MKQSHTQKGTYKCICASTYNFNILNSINPELQLKDTEYAIRNKLIDLLTRLQKIESDDKIKYGFFIIRTQNNKQLLIKVTLIMQLNQYIVLFYQRYKNV